MAALKAKASKAGLTTGTAQITLLQIKAASNQRVRIQEIGVGFHGIVNTNAPITVELLFQSSAGTMTTLAAGYTSSGGVAALDQDVVETIQTTAQHTATAEPTYVTSAAGPWAIHPQTGIVYPIKVDDVVLKGGGYVGIVVTAGVSTTCDVYIKFEE